MKTIPQGFTDSLDTERTLTGARAVIRANRLKFTTTRDISHTDSLLGSDEAVLTQYDADIVASDVRYTNPILRVAIVYSSGYKLAYQYITDPRSDVSTWNHWVVTLKPAHQYCKPGVFDNRIFFEKSTGVCVFLDYDYLTDSLGTETILYTADTNHSIGFAPTSKTSVYLKTNVPGSSNWDRGYLDRWYNLDVSPTSSRCPAISYGSLDTLQGFDAVNISGMDYVFFGGDYGKRAEYIVYDEGHWSPIAQVINLDIIDEEAAFAPEFASVINDHLFLTLTITRDSGSTFQGYTIGPAPFTLGRDIYITNGTSYGGKFFSLEDGANPAEIYYLGPKTCYVARSVAYTGAADDAVNYLDTGEIAELVINMDKNNPSAFQIAIGGTAQSSALLQEGNEINLYASLNDSEAQLGAFAIDSVSADKSELGTQRAIAGRGQAGKRLSQWTSDAYYDLWSQTKQSCNPSALTEMIRLDGQWSTEEVGGVTYLRLDDLNEEHTLSSAMKSSRGCITRARFKAPTNESDYTPTFGLYANLYRAFDAASSRDGDMVISGIKAKVTPTNWYLYHQRNSMEATQLSSGSWTMPNNQLFWLELEYRDGKIILRRRLDTGTSWTILTSTYFEVDGYSPYGASIRSGAGKPGLWMLNSTPASSTPGFASDDTVIPLNDLTHIPTSCTLLADDEQITVDGRSTLLQFSYGNDRVVSSGYTFMDAPHDNIFWIDGVVMSLPVGDTEADQAFCSADTNKYLAWSFRPEGSITINKLQVRIKKVGSPALSVYAYLATDDWDTHPPDSSAVLTYGTVTAANIGTDYDWVEFTFAASQNLTAENYWLVITNAPVGSAPTIDASNYYMLSVDENTPYSEGYFFLYDGGTPHWVARDPLGKPPYKLIGSGNGGDGYEIYMDGVGAANPRFHFDNCALVVTGGPGKGAVFKIVDYDYQAPSQWVPSRFYNPPDRWQDHVGDLDHGAWSTPSMHRIFVEENPSGSLAAGSQVSIYPAMLVTQRGANSTIATSHSTVTVSKYTSTSILCDRFEYYSTDMDYRLEDVFLEIVRKAGVINTFSAQKEAYGTYTKSSSGWEVLADPRQSRNFIIKHTIPSSGNAVQTRFRWSYILGSYSGGMTFKIDTTSISLLDASENVIQSWSPGSSVANDWVTISVQENDYCVWFRDRLVAAYHDDTPPEGDYAFVGADDTVTFNLDWSACDRRVDNFTLDAGSRGDQLLSQLINKKRFYWLDTNDGGIKLFKTGDTISGTYSLAALNSTGTNEQDLITRIRVMGLYEYETFDPDKMRDYGNLYAEANIEDADTYTESVQEANKILDDMVSRLGQHQLIGAADPRIEPMDVITYNSGGSDTTIKVGAVSINLSLSDDLPVFDMTVEGFNG